MPKGFKLEMGENILKSVDHNKPQLKKQKISVNFYTKIFLLLKIFLIILIFNFSIKNIFLEEMTHTQQRLRNSQRKANFRIY
jgi:hypothetical protein